MNKDKASQKTTETKSAKERPKYNMWQNSGYMIALAWQRQKNILFFCLIAYLI